MPRAAFQRGRWHCRTDRFWRQLRDVVLRDVVVGGFNDGVFQMHGNARLKRIQVEVTGMG